LIGDNSFHELLELSQHFNFSYLFYHILLFWKHFVRSQSLCLYRNPFQTVQQNLSWWNMCSFSNAIIPLNLKSFLQRGPQQNGNVDNTWLLNARLSKLTKVNGSSSIYKSPTSVAILFEPRLETNYKHLF